MQKQLTLEQYIEYRNKLVTRRDARLRVFGNKSFTGKHKDYYSIKLQILDDQYPQFKGLGKVHLK